MKNKIFISLAVLALIISLFSPKFSRSTLSELELSNVEALAAGTESDSSDPDIAKGRYLESKYDSKGMVISSCCMPRSATDECNYKHEYKCN